MPRHISLAREVADDLSVETRHRCLSCNGIIAGLVDRDLATGLNVRLGLVSDECALICNECTAKLIDARGRRCPARDDDSMA